MKKIDTTACNNIDLPKMPKKDGKEQVSVLIPLPLAKAYNYSVPKNLELKLGDFVKVPLGSRQVVGVVWEKSGNKNDPKSHVQLTYQSTSINNTMVTLDTSDNILKKNPLPADAFNLNIMPDQYGLLRQHGHTPTPDVLQPE